MAGTTLEGGRSPLETRAVARDRTDTFDDANVIVVSNRQPYRHEWDGDEVTVSRPTGGLAEGLDAAARGNGWTWVAWGDGDADRTAVDDDDCVTIPPDADEGDQYTLQRIWLDEDQVENYYYGYSNRVLWPVCHSTLTNVHGEREYWETYRQVNERFADAIVGRAAAGDVVLLQDYHLARVPGLVRGRVPGDVSIAHFWHIPWPSWDTFRACPQSTELLRGLLGNDLFGVHVPRYRENVLGCVDAAIPEADVDWSAGRVFHRDGVTTVESFPLGVDTDRIERLAADRSTDRRWAEFRSRYGIDHDGHVAVCVDRLDYSKGIPERLDALERFFETHPERRGELTVVQVGTESRSRIDAYDELQEEIEESVDRVNDRFGTDDWQPVVYTTRRVPNETLYALYRNADVGIVSPLRDGMNLVAQEYVAAQVDGDDPGVLLLSDQAGVHDVLGGAAVSVPPLDTGALADALETALTMPADERLRRMSELTAEVGNHDISTWVDDVLERIAAIRTDTDDGRGRV